MGPKETWSSESSLLELTNVIGKPIIHGKSGQVPSIYGSDKLVKKPVTVNHPKAGHLDPDSLLGFNIRRAMQTRKCAPFERELLERS